jgi:two-component system chemotaxis response regulator CheY
MQLLIVDDDATTRHALAALLRGPGRSVHLAEDGEHAWSMLQGGLRPVLCCSDVSMPHLDGLGLLRRAQRHPLWHDLPFVLVSAGAEAATLLEATSAGAAGYVLKPFMHLQTRATVDGVLREHLARRSEHFLVSARRLGVDLEELERSLEALASQATLVAETAGAVAPQALDRLRRDCAAHGLWRAQRLLAQREGGCEVITPGLLDTRAVLEEVRALIDEQLAALRELAPSAF